jgi:hypothetical protein
LTGAILHLEFPAEDFAADVATVEVIPPEGEVLSVDFNLASLN